MLLVGSWYEYREDQGSVQSHFALWNVGAMVGTNTVACLSEKKYAMLLVGSWYEYRGDQGSVQSKFALWNVDAIVGTNTVPCMSE